MKRVVLFIILFGLLGYFAVHITVYDVKQESQFRRFESKFFKRLDNIEQRLKLLENGKKYNNEFNYQVAILLKKNGEDISRLKANVYFYNAVLLNFKKEINALNYNFHRLKSGKRILERLNR